MRTKLGLILLAALFLLTSNAFADPDPNFYVFLCFGQSNMESGGQMNDQDRTVDSRFQVMADFDNARRGWKKDNWYDAVPPLAAKGSGICMIDYFGRTLVENLPEGIRVGVIKVSVPGCKIELFEKDTFQSYVATAQSWMVNLVNQYGGNPYQYMIDMAKVAQKDGVIKGILLHQGESNPNDNEWPNKVKGIYDNIIKDLNLNPDEVPFLAGETVNEDQGGACAGFNKIMAKLPETLPNSYVISSAGCTANADRMHFNSAGSREFGKRYGEQMLKLLNNEVKIPETQAANSEQAIVPDSSWSCYMPEGIPAPEKGTLVFEIQMNLDQIYDIGKTQFGQRVAYVVKDGKVTGDKLQASVMPLGLDYELTLSNGVVEIEQILVFRTNDNRYIYVRSPGTGLNENDVRIVMDFEAPNGSSSAWLNTGKFVARRAVDTDAKTITMKVYDVAEVEVDKANVAKISKPEGIPYQSWEFRRAAQGEQRGEQIITELVTLGGSTSVGQSKRGNRNIIPITGGTLSGMITGKVVPGGADYQNLAQGTIDARYMWQTDKGEIIIVRNAGPFSGLVPTFETNVDGEFSWLNSGLYLSSGPGMGGGGVTLTMYKSK